MMAELDGDTHRFEHGDRVAAKVLAHRRRCVVEVPTVVDRPRRLTRLGQLFEQEELDLGVGVEREPHVSSATQVHA